LTGDAANSVRDRECRIYTWLESRPRTLIASGGANTFGGGFDDELTGNQARCGRDGRRVL